MKYSNYAVILAGGVGSRFWPLSWESKPKQFLSLNGEGKKEQANTQEFIEKIKLLVTKFFLRKV